MKLTTQTDYALRTLVYLGNQTSRAKVADVAALFGISVNHIAKVVNLLARDGYIQSKRGIGGGIELAVGPEDIVLGEIIRLSEGELHLLPCVGDDESCVIHSFCKLRTVLSEAERIQLEYFDTITLADVMPSRSQLHQLR